MLSDMQAGRLLLRAGKLREARALLERARPDGEAGRIERLFLLGRIALRLGMPRRAAERFEAALALRPGLTRVRLELARALHLAGRDDEARRQLRLARADGLPPPVAAAVEGFLRRIDARRRWSASLSAAALPDVKRANREVVRIGGVPFRLNEDARSSSGAGARVSAGMSFSPVVAGDLRGVLALSAAAKVYERAAWNDVSVSGDLGLARLFDRGSASAGLRLDRRWSGGSGDYRGAGPFARARIALSGSARLELEASASWRAHDAGRDRDGWRVAAVPRLVLAPDARSRIELEPVVEAGAARADHHRSVLVGLGAAVWRAFDGGAAVSLASSFRLRRHAGRDPLFGIGRRDETFRLDLRLSHRALRHAGFAPYVGWALERNRSNVPIHEYRYGGVAAGFSRAF